MSAQLYELCRLTFLCLQVKLSCCRSTPADSPNADFIAHLHTIRDHRTLTSDEVGIRAYSTAIATLQAYPYPLISSSEIVLLPGCNVKIAALFHSWLSSHTDPKLRTVPDVEKLKLNENLVGLAMLHRIWGVGPETAREWWFVRGWRNVDDVVEYGWKGLTRVQQIGVKYYDDFQKPMMRWEAERIRGVYYAVTILAVRKHNFIPYKRKKDIEKRYRKLTDI